VLGAFRAVVGVFSVHRTELLEYSSNPMRWHESNFCNPLATSPGTTQSNDRNFFVVYKKKIQKDWHQNHNQSILLYIKKQTKLKKDRHQNHQKKGCHLQGNCLFIGYYYY